MGSDGLFAYRRQGMACAGPHWPTSFPSRVRNIAGALARSRLLTGGPPNSGTRIMSDKMNFRNNISECALFHKAH
jgi:hypothetical protein